MQVDEPERETVESGHRTERIISPVRNQEDFSIGVVTTEIQDTETDLMNGKERRKGDRQVDMEDLQQREHAELGDLSTSDKKDRGEIRATMETQKDNQYKAESSKEKVLKEFQMDTVTLEIGDIVYSPLLPPMSAPIPVQRGHKMGDDKIDDKQHERTKWDTRDDVDYEKFENDNLIHDIHEDYYDSATISEINAYIKYDEQHQQGRETVSQFSDNEDEHISSVSENEDEAARNNVLDDVDNAYNDKFPLCNYIFPSLSTPNIPSQYEKSEGMGRVTSEQLLTTYGDNDFHPRTKSPHTKIFKSQTPKFTTKAYSFKHYNPLQKSTPFPTFRWSHNDLSASNPHNDYNSGLMEDIKVS